MKKLPLSDIAPEARPTSMMSDEQYVQDQLALLKSMPCTIAVDDIANDDLGDDYDDYAESIMSACRKHLTSEFWSVTTDLLKVGESSRFPSWMGHAYAVEPDDAETLGDHS